MRQGRLHYYALDYTLSREKVSLQEQLSESQDQIDKKSQLLTIARTTDENLVRGLYSLQHCLSQKTARRI